jgi:hypothetical protein
MTRHKPKWEKVSRDTERMRVGSGWLYRTCERDRYNQIITLSAPTFVPLQKKVRKPKAGQS